MLSELQYAFGKPASRARLKATPEDFRVTEVLGFEPSGAGEHVMLWVRKRDANSQFVARQLARLAGVREQDVSFAGMKDRFAVTEQWFSVHLPGKSAPDWSVLGLDGVEVLRAERHDKKLRRGALKGNQFEIVLSELEADDTLESRLEQVGSLGVPNYFGAQRFGREGRNLEKALALFRGQLRLRRNQQGIYLSAARSLLFNLVVSERLRRTLADRLLVGDALQLCGSHSFFIVDTVDDSLLQRLASGDVQLTAPLWGRGPLPVNGEVEALELAVVEAQPELTAGLEKAGLKQERRALWLKPQQWQWQRQDARLTLRFFLPSGCFATSVIRELVQLKGEDDADFSE